MRGAYYCLPLKRHWEHGHHHQHIIGPGRSRPPNGSENNEGQPAEVDTRTERARKHSKVKRDNSARGIEEGGPDVLNDV